MNIAANLDEAMQRRGFKSQSALGRAAGVPQPTINRILKGITPTPDLQTLQKLADALGVDVEWITDRKGHGPDAPKREQKMPLSDETRSLFGMIIELESSFPETAAKLVHIFSQLVAVVSLGARQSRAARTLDIADVEAEELLSGVNEPGGAHATTTSRKSRHRS